MESSDDKPTHFAIGLNIQTQYLDVECKQILFNYNEKCSNEWNVQNCGPLVRVLNVLDVLICGVAWLV